MVPQESPLHQFLIKTLVPLHVGGVDLSLTNAAAFMLLAACLPLVFLWIGRPYHTKPGRWQAVLEMGYQFVADILGETNLDKGLPFFPLIASVFMFVLMGNMLGMIPYGFTFTSHIIATFGLAGLLFLIITAIGIVKHKGRFLAMFLPPGVPWLLWPLMIPVEVLSYLSRPFSLAVRLFANMMAGHTMLKVFGGFTVALGLWGVAPLVINVLLMGFEFMVSFLQAYVFTILTCIYLSDALYLHGADHDE
nr:F0F1 ATP synthase subunit A [Candidatus Hepatobacter penaei]